MFLGARNQSLVNLEGVIKTEVGYCGGDIKKLLIKKYVLAIQIMLKLLN